MNSTAGRSKVVRKSTGTSKPVPAHVQNFLSAYLPGVRDLALELRELVMDVSPDAIEHVDLPARLLRYGFAETNKHTFCVLLLSKNAVTLGFPRGTELPDPNKLLTGTGKRARQVKLTSGDEIDKPALRALIRMSVSLAKG